MKRNLWYGVILWAIIFVEVSVIGFTPTLATQGENGFVLLPMGLVLHFLLLATMAFLLATQYFKKATPSPKAGVKAAAVMVGVGLVLDALITVPFFVKSYVLFYTKWSLWVGIALVLIIFAWRGKKLEKHPDLARDF